MNNIINSYKTELENHSLLVTNAIQTKSDLKIFMEHHVYAVWDFMSLAKSLQHNICPSGNLWLPNKLQRSCSRLINEIILSEESDLDPIGDGYISHFDLYCQAMMEIGADITGINYFLKSVEIHGLEWSMENCNIPLPSKTFMNSTFKIIKRNKAHQIAAAFAHGRETVIPNMFRRILSQSKDKEVPRFNHYLDRHIEVDEKDHGPATNKLIIELCEHDPIKIFEAETAAVEAIKARILFWDEIENLL